jgi:hypothetical protein
MSRPGSRPCFIGTDADAQRTGYFEETIVDVDSVINLARLFGDREPDGIFLASVVDIRMSKEETVEAN